MLKEPKTKSGKRTISPPTGVIETLKAVLVDQNKQYLKLHEGKSNDGYVFDERHRTNRKRGDPARPRFDDCLHSPYCEVVCPKGQNLQFTPYHIN